MAEIFDSFIQGVDAGQQQAQRTRTRNALNQAGALYSSGDYEGAENALVAAGLPDVAGQYSALAEARRNRTNRTAAQQAVAALPGDASLSAQAQAVGRAYTAGGDIEQGLQYQHMGQQFNQEQAQLAVQAHDAVASFALGQIQRGVPVGQRQADAQAHAADFSQQTGVPIDQVSQLIAQQTDWSDNGLRALAASHRSASEALAAQVEEQRYQQDLALRREQVGIQAEQAQAQTFWLRQMLGATDTVRNQPSAGAYLAPGENPNATINIGRLEQLDPQHRVSGVGGSVLVGNLRDNLARLRANPSADMRQAFMHTYGGMTPEEGRAALESYAAGDASNHTMQLAIDAANGKPINTMGLRGRDAIAAATAIPEMAIRYIMRRDGVDYAQASSTFQSAQNNFTGTQRALSNINVQGANVERSMSEIDNFMQVAQPLVQGLHNGQFPTLNAFNQQIQRLTGQPNIQAATLALRTALAQYARATEGNFGNGSTHVAALENGLQQLSTAASPAQMQAAFNLVRQELPAVRQSFRTIRNVLDYRMRHGDYEYDDPSIYQHYTGNTASPQSGGASMTGGQVAMAGVVNAGGITFSRGDLQSALAIVSSGRATPQQFQQRTGITVEQARAALSAPQPATPSDDTLDQARARAAAAGGLR